MSVSLSMRRRTFGFSLIELMVVMVILALMLALALPAYHGHIVRAKRVQGQAALLKLMQQQERYYSQNNRYAAFSSDAFNAGQFKWWSGATAADSAYEIQALACPGLPLTHCVKLVAIPGSDKVDSAFKDRHCATLALDSTGRRFASGAAARCWP